MNPTSGAVEEWAPDLSCPEGIDKKVVKQRLHRLHTDPGYRATQRLKAQIGQSNSVAKHRNTKVSLPKFSWDKQS